MAEKPVIYANHLDTVLQTAKDKTGTRATNTSAPKITTLFLFLISTNKANNTSNLSEKHHTAELNSSPTFCPKNNLPSNKSPNLIFNKSKITILFYRKSIPKNHLNTIQSFNFTLTFKMRKTFYY